MSNRVLSGGVIYALVAFAAMLSCSSRDPNLCFEEMTLVSDGWRHTHTCSFDGKGSLEAVRDQVFWVCRCPPSKLNTTSEVPIAEPIKERYGDN